MKNDPMCTRSGNALKEAAWVHMRTVVANLELPFGWARQFTPGSLIVHNERRTVYVKVTTAGEVFVDRKQRDLSYKSEHHKFIHVLDACLKAKETLLEESGKGVRVFE